MINDIKLKNVKSFTYLECKITSDEKSNIDINCRITKHAFFKKKKKTIKN